MTIYIYLKTHNKTGLKYIGKTIKPDVHKYQGSGLVWRRHIKKHGYDVTTEILGEFEDIKKASKFSVSLSKELDIVKSSEYANLMIETCFEGTGPERDFTYDHKVNMSKAHEGEKHSSSRKKKVSASLLGKTKSKNHVKLMAEGKEKWSKIGTPDSCPSCGFKTKWPSAMRRHINKQICIKNLGNIGMRTL